MPLSIWILLAILALVIAWLWPLPVLWVWPPEWRSPTRQLIRLGLPAAWLALLVLGLTVFDGPDAKVEGAAPVRTVATTATAPLSAQSPPPPPLLQRMAIPPGPEAARA
ncbi:MAG: hypothetical protein ACRDLN_10630, partial [Solirubrobacteraceae bacterium]